MSTKAVEKTSSFDALKWLIVIALIVGGVVAFNMLSEQSVLIQAGVVIGATILAIVTAMTTAKGKAFWTFAREARTELRKVIWPTSGQTVKSSIAIIIMVIILGVFLWLLDWLIVTVLGLITG